MTSGFFKTKKPSFKILSERKVFIMQKNKSQLFISLVFLFGFALWTVLVKTIDVRAIGPCGSSVGFATINGLFHEFTGVNMTLYTVTDWLGLLPVAVGFGFAILGLCEWIKRKNILKVDPSLLALGIFYIVVIGFYILFEYLIINYRPTLINGFLEVSYPSSTTLLVTTVMPTALMQFKSRIKNKILNRTATVLTIAFTVFMVVGRLLSGVHWLSDIIGGLLLSTGLVMGYRCATDKTENRPVSYNPNYSMFKTKTHNAYINHND